MRPLCQARAPMDSLAMGQSTLVQARFIAFAGRSDRAARLIAVLADAAA